MSTFEQLISILDLCNNNYRIIKDTDYIIVTLYDSCDNYNSVELFFNLDGSPNNDYHGC